MHRPPPLVHRSTALFAAALIATLLVSNPTRAADPPAANGYTMDSIVLYQPEAAIAPRIPAVAAFADYVKQLRAVCEGHVAAVAKPEPLDVVVVVKPGRQVRVWFASTPRADDDKELRALAAKLEAVPVMDVLIGPVAFALSGHVGPPPAAAKPAAGTDGFRPPLPRAWKAAVDAAKGPTKVPDDILAVVWPDAPGAANELPAPKSYAVQKLEGLGGQILRPEGWSFRASAIQTSLVYQMAKEDVTAGKGFVTGFTINVIPKISTVGEGKLKAADHAKAYLDNYAKRCTVITREEPSSQANFARQGMTVDQRLTLMGKPVDCRLGITTFASNDLDLLVVMTFGCPVAEWEANQPIYKTICSDVRLVGR